jgi:hypothetical protein
VTHDRVDKPNEHIEFRYYTDDGADVLDDFVATNASIHFECMDNGSWWMGIQTPDGRSFAVNVGVHRNPEFVREHAAIRWREKHLTNWAFHEEDA